MKLWLSEGAQATTNKGLSLTVLNNQGVTTIIANYVGNSQLNHSICSTQNVHKESLSTAARDLQHTVVYRDNNNIKGLNSKQRLQ